MNDPILILGLTLLFMISVGYAIFLIAENIRIDKDFKRLIKRKKTDLNK